jgi:hypothetical protein
LSTVLNPGIGTCYFVSKSLVRFLGLMAISCNRPHQRTNLVQISCSNNAQSASAGYALRNPGNIVYTINFISIQQLEKVHVICVWHLNKDVPLCQSFPSQLISNSKIGINRILTLRRIPPFEGTASTEQRCVDRSPVRPRRQQQP